MRDAATDGDLTIRAGAAEATLDPGLGAGLVRLSLRGEAILSTGEGRPAGSPFAQGMNLLLPFSNRISRPFDWEGAQHAVAPNLAGEPYPIHGDAFQKPWEVAFASADTARLCLSGGIGPWRYDATADYRLAPDALSCRLSVTNRADRTLPHGGGFHPWFPRHPGTRLRFFATGHWPEDARHLPATAAPVPAPADARFETPAPLPARWINCGFAGWDGRLDILQPGHRLHLAAPGLATLLLYSPGADAPYFCVEPVSHPVDALNLPGRPGLVPLAPGETLTMELRLGWTET